MNDTTLRMFEVPLDDFARVIVGMRKRIRDCGVDPDEGIKVEFDDLGLSLSYFCSPGPNVMYFMIIGRRWSAYLEVRQGRVSPLRPDKFDTYIPWDDDKFIALSQWDNPKGDPSEFERDMILAKMAFT